MTEQEKFEAMFFDPSLDKTKRHDRPDQYKDLTANLLWEGWQAAIASRSPMTQQQQAGIMHPDDDMATFIRTIASVESFHWIGE